jgi:hypothetical protein
LSDHRYVVDITLHSPGELEMVLRDELPETPEQQEPRIYRRRHLGIGKEEPVIRLDVLLLPLDEEDRQKFEDFTQRLYEDQHFKLYEERDL